MRFTGNRIIMRLINKAGSILQLTRWPNLAMIVLIQLSLYYVVIHKIYQLSNVEGALNYKGLSLLVLITVLIAAAGYAINDYFDMRVDRINKPGSMILGNKINHRTAVVLHITFNAIATMAGFYLAYTVGYWRLGFLFPMIIILLWLYSATYKRTVLWGNIAIAVMGALVVLLVWLFEFFALIQYPERFIAVSPYLSLITRYFVFYAGFAFLLTLFREIIKDAEDVRGDKLTGCKTLVVVHGLEKSKRIAAGVIVSSIIFVGYMIFSFIYNHNTIPGLYFLVTVFIPLVYILTKTLKATHKSDFHSLSTLIKLIMIAGIVGLQPISLTIG